MKAKDIITEKCWPGYEKKGMKTHFGKRVPNCVKKESVDAVSLDKNGNLVFEDNVSEDLKKWFKEKWVRFGPDGKIRGECGGRSDSEGKPKCLPQSKAQALGKKGRSKSAAKKRREDPNPERKGKAKNVATKTRTMKEAPMRYDNEERSADKLNPLQVARDIYKLKKDGISKSDVTNKANEIIKNVSRIGQDSSSENVLKGQGEQAVNYVKQIGKWLGIGKKDQ
jgi:hypothetical protein